MKIMSNTCSIKCFKKICTKFWIWCNGFTKHFIKIKNEINCYFYDFKIYKRFDHKTQTCTLKFTHKNRFYVRSQIRIGLGFFILFFHEIKVVVHLIVTLSLFKTRYLGILCLLSGACIWIGLTWTIQPTLPIRAWLFQGNIQFLPTFSISLGL